MRVASRIAFGDRQSGNRNPKKRYFLAFEGKLSEYRYFRGLIGRFQREIQSFPLIEVVLFARKDEHEGHSNPIQIVSYTIDTIHAGSFPLDLTYQELFEDYLFKAIGITCDRSLKNLAFCKSQRLLSKYHSDMQAKVSPEVINTFLKNIQDVIMQPLISHNGLDIMKEVLESYELEDISYQKGVDSVCIIVDRDSHSFTSSQYDDVVKKCDAEGFRLYITNPCFEFFLLLHKTDCAEYPNDTILKNRKKGKYSYIEKKLKEFVPRYDKGNVLFQDFDEDISTAMNNCLCYAQTLEEIKDRVGTNLHTLVAELLSQ